MGGAFVFPGGAAEPGEDPRGPRRASCSRRRARCSRAAGAAGAERRGRRDARALLDGASCVEVLAERGLAFDPDALSTSRTGSRRRRAEALLGALLRRGPARRQEPRFDDIETVDQAWVTPADALARAGELALPPPQVRTSELAPAYPSTTWSR